MKRARGAAAASRAHSLVARDGEEETEKEHREIYIM
jgi:hypothetical protein